ncbi:MAG: YggT family protein [Actinobacteria bacterium]|nr:YggT family protein [Actinomycetota bacterium]
MSRVVCVALQVFWLVVVARIVLEWVHVSGDEHPVARARWVLRRLTDPVLRPLRRLIPPLRTGGVAIDLSPMVLLVGLWILSGIVCL